MRGSWCSKSSLAKAAGAEVAVLADRWKMARRCGAKHICKSKCTKHLIVGAIFEVPMFTNGTPLWREAHLQVKMWRNWRVRTTFWTADVEISHAAVARSTCASHAKHIGKSKCPKNLSAGPILEVSIRKNCTPLWREAHFQVQMCKTPHSRATFWRSDV